MKGVIAIAKKEFSSYFNSPIAILSMVVFWVITGIYFFMINGFFQKNLATIRPLFEWIPLLFVFFVPALSMRLFSEEKKSGTFELLVTYPVSDLQIVLGKFFGSLLFLTIIIALTLVYPITISFIGTFDWGPIIGGYIGLIFVGAAYLAIGIMASVWTKNQIVAFILALVISAFFYFIDKMLSIFWVGAQSFLYFISFNYHFQNISKGVLDTRDIIYFTSVCVVAIAITVYSLKSRNWK